MKKVTFVLTSCGRNDLLEQTLDSFFKWNTHPIERFIITEDSADHKVFEECERLNREKYGGKLEFVFNRKKLGQSASIDKAYAMVDTEYIFHCEEDWEFYRGGFIEDSIKVLETQPKVIQAWIRPKSDRILNQIDSKIYNLPGDVKIRRVLPISSNIVEKNKTVKNYIGFSWNPGLKRLKDWQELPNGYSGFISEHLVDAYYRDNGFIVVSLSENDQDGYVKHIGWNKRANRKMSDVIKGYWYESPNINHATNWGDAINPWLIENISKLKVSKSTECCGRLFAAGSILDHGIKDGDIIWGTGSITNHTIKPGLNIDIRAVRGPLTRNNLINSGYTCPDIYGDPALLVKDYYNPNIEVTHDIGIIPHITERDDPAVLDLIKRTGIKLIDIGLGHTEFIDEIKSVKLIISSSLHGLIVADAYGIPNARVNISNKLTGGHYKYIDYFTSVGRSLDSGNLIYNGVDLLDLIKVSHFNREIKIDLDRLRNSFPFS